MDFTGISGAIGGIVDIATGIQNMSINRKNYEKQIENQKYQRQIQRESWQRDDNAVERRVNDLKKVGLSPTLAAGSSASSSSPIQINSPSREQNQKLDLSDKMLNVLSVMKAKNDVSASASQADLIELQKSRQALENERLKWDNNYLKRYNISTFSPVIDKNLKAGSGFVKEVIEKLPKNKNPTEINQQEKDMISAYRYHFTKKGKEQQKIKVKNYELKYGKPR